MLVVTFDDVPPKAGDCDEAHNLTMMWREIVSI